MQTNTKIVMAGFILLQCHLRVLLLTCEWDQLSISKGQVILGLLEEGAVHVQLHKDDIFPLAVIATVWDGAATESENTCWM